MKSARELAEGTAPASAGPDFVATREGGLATITPLKPLSRVWLRSRVERGASWVGDSLVVEMRYFPDIADAIIDAGFVFERDAYVN